MIYLVVYERISLRIQSCGATLQSLYCRILLVVTSHNSCVVYNIYFSLSPPLLTFHLSLGILSGTSIVPTRGMVSTANCEWVPHHRPVGSTILATRGSKSKRRLLVESLFRGWWYWANGTFSHVTYSTTCFFQSKLTVYVFGNVHTVLATATNDKTFDFRQYDTSLGTKKFGHEELKDMFGRTTLHHCASLFLEDSINVRS
jgi:hypothetical protein